MEAWKTLRVLKFAVGNKLVTHLCQDKRELTQGTLQSEPHSCGGSRRAGGRGERGGILSQRRSESVSRINGGDGNGRQGRAEWLHTCVCSEGSERSDQSKRTTPCQCLESSLGMGQLRQEPKVATDTLSGICQFTFITKICLHYTGTNVKREI